MTTTPKRRHLLVLALTAGGSALACGGDAGSDDSGSVGASGSSSSGGGGGGTFPEGYVDLGSVEGLPLDSLVTVSALELLVGHDAGGVYAMTSRCTHEQCNMIANDGITPGNITVCGCHNSEFDPNGVPIKGPASQPLAHFDVIVNEARHIGVNTAIVVDLEQRAPVPA